jgi:hypothetical protein
MMTNQTNTSEATEPIKRGPGRPRRMARPPESSADADTPAERDPAPAAQPRSNKTTAIIALLSRPDGATLAELIAATGWLPHTTRAALTGLRKRGHAIERFKREDTTCYCIVAAAQ